MQSIASELRDRATVSKCICWIQVHVDITHSEDKVKIDGPPEEVERAQLELDSFVKNLLATLIYVELAVDPKFYKHIIGKGGANSE